jgi:putative addiction module component (TIGR02574 family)
MAERDILNEALKLSPEERARIAQELLRSLDEDADEDPAAVEAAWAVEIERRAVRAQRGQSSGRDLAVVCDELEFKPRG